MIDTACKYCHEQLPDEARYCPGCGGLQHPRPIPRRTLGMLLAVLGVVLLGLGDS